MRAQPLALVILISGSGSNLQAIIDAIVCCQLQAKINAVISNRSDAYGLVRAASAGIPTEVLDAKAFSDRRHYDMALQQRIDFYQSDLVILAGFMRILSAELVTHYYGRMINIHPSLLPKYRGLHTHQQVLVAGDVEHGATVHFVDHDLDAGPIIAQARLKVFATDTAESLKKRVLSVEHVLYPTVIQWFAEERLQLRDHCVYFDGKVLPPHGYQASIEIAGSA